MYWPLIDAGVFLAGIGGLAYQYRIAGRSVKKMKETARNTRAATE